MSNRKPQTYRPITRVQAKLLDTAEEMFFNKAGEKDAAFMARQLVQATLPHKNPGDVPAWSRKNGNLMLGIQPGMNIETGKSYGYPYGTIPRLLLFWMTTEAARTKSRHLELGHSLSRFMTDLGLNSANGGTGAKRSDAARLKNQMERLFRARISFQRQQQAKGKGPARCAWLDMQVAPEGMLWWDHKNPQQTTLWGSWIELGDKFYEAITASPVPVDMRALKALKRSPLALDLYAWLTHEAYRAHKKNEVRFVTWELLHAQFGGDYAEMRNFQQAVRKALAKVGVVYSDLILGDRRGGIEVLPGSLPAVFPRF